MRKLDWVILSDIHLGMYGCKAEELNNYLQSIQPQQLILNGDIIDIWEFNKNYFPQSHLAVLKTIMKMMEQGTKVTYITGNHDELLRRFTDFELGNFELVNKKVLTIGNQKVWIFHGDVFDASIQQSKWLAKLGSKGYDIILRLNFWVNWGLQKMGKEKYSLSKKIKQRVKSAVKYISNFEQTAANLAIEYGYDYVICGHIHIPQMREVRNSKGKTTYLNAGDWIENLTALEFQKGQFELYEYQAKDFPNPTISNEMEDMSLQDLVKKIQPE